MKYFMIVRNLNYRQVWWPLYLARFDFMLYYCPRKLMDKSDALFQWLDYNTGFYNNEDIILIKLEFFTIQVIECIIVEGKKKALLIDIHHGN